MIIPCSEGCIYQKEGLCTLTQVTSSSKTPLEDCPYFRSKDEKDDEEKDRMEIQWLHPIFHLRLLVQAYLQFED